MTFAREADVVISFGTGTPGNPPESWNELGCPKGTWTLGSSTASIDDALDNWCTALEASIEGASPGAKTITIAGTMELVLSDAAYLEMVAAEAANTYSWFRIEISDSQNSNSEDYMLGGYFTDFTYNFNGTGPSDVSVSFRASERQGWGS